MTIPPRVPKARQRVRPPGTERIPAGRAHVSRAWRAWSRGGAASQLSRQRLRDRLEAAAGCSLLSSRARGSVRGKAAKGLGAPRRGRGAAGGAGTDLASGAVPQHHQLELAVRTLLLLRVRHDLYGPGKKEEAESSREEPGAGARTEQREERAPRSRNRQQRRSRHRHLPSARPPSLWSARGETNGSAEERGGSGKLRAGATATSSVAASGHTHFSPRGSGDGSARLSAARRGGSGPAVTPCAVTKQRGAGRGRGYAPAPPSEGRAHPVWG